MNAMTLTNIFHSDTPNGLDVIYKSAQNQTYLPAKTDSVFQIYF